MSFRMQMTNKLVDPSRANFQQDDYTTINVSSSSSSKTDDADKNHATSNTTFSQNTPRINGPGIRVTNTSSEDFM